MSLTLLMSRNKVADGDTQPLYAVSKSKRLLGFRTPDPAVFSGIRRGLRQWDKDF